MNKFEYRIYNSVYNEMISGKKKIEFRLLNDKSRSIDIGDEIKFSVVDDNNKYLLVEVTNIYLYDDIDSLWNSSEANHNLLCYSKDELTNIFYNIFGKENVLNSKIVGFEFIIKSINSDEME